MHGRTKYPVCVCGEYILHTRGGGVVKEVQAEPRGDPETIRVGNATSLL